MGGVGRAAPARRAGAGVLFWLLSRNKNLASPQYMLLPAFLLALMASHIVNGWPGGALVQLGSFGPAVLAFIVLSHVAANRERGDLDHGRDGAVFARAGRARHRAVRDRDRLDRRARCRRKRASSTSGIFNDPNDLGLVVHHGPADGAVSVQPRRIARACADCSGSAPPPRSLYGIYLTNSRGALVALVVLVAVWVWRRRGLVTAGILGAGLLAGMMMLPSRLAELDASESSAAGRVDSWYSGLEMFISKPIFGMGLACSPTTTGT